MEISAKMFLPLVRIRGSNLLCISLSASCTTVKDNGLCISYSIKNRMQIHLLVPTATTKLCLKTWWLRTAQYFHFPAQIWNQARLQTAVQSTCTRMCHSHMMRCGPWPWPWREQTTTSPTTPPHLCAASVTAMLTLPMPFLTLWSWPTLEEYRWVRACTRGLLGVAVLYLEM